ncbi:MAG: InlB B-repeat-containing protein, partial [Oscillospiraceae bacterium]|nr:InlB B-repeat-containing protein [Oscillospiraceae bacterium]
MKRLRILFALSAAFFAAILLFSCTGPQEVPSGDIPTEDIFPEVVTFSVMLDAQNGTAPTTVSVEEGRMIAPPDTPVRLGYVFGGWRLGSGEDARFWSFEADK